MRSWYLSKNLRAARGWRFDGKRWALSDLPPPALAGDAQFDNAATAIAALEELDSPLPVPAAAIARGLRAVRLVGRFQIIEPGRDQRTWILDVAHNRDAAAVLAGNLRGLPFSGRTLAVCGILADKDAPAIAAALRGCFDVWWLASTQGARGSSAETLSGRMSAEAGAPLRLADSVAAACAGALAASRPGDRIVVFGSFHTVGPAIDWLEARGLLPLHLLPEYTDAPAGQN